MTYVAVAPPTIIYLITAPWNMALYQHRHSRFATNLDSCIFLDVKVKGVLLYCCTRRMVSRIKCYGGMNVQFLDNSNINMLRQLCRPSPGNAAAVGTALQCTLLLLLPPPPPTTTTPSTSPHQSSASYSSTITSSRVSIVSPQKASAFVIVIAGRT